MEAHWKKAKNSQTKMAKYTFTEDEMSEMGKNLASGSMNRKQLEDEKKTITSQYTARLAAVQAEINLLSNNINTGSTTKQYSCDVFLDFDNDVKFFHEKGTGLFVAREAMESTDYQLELDL